MVGKTKTYKRDFLVKLKQVKYIIESRETLFAGAGACIQDKNLKRLTV